MADTFQGQTLFIRATISAPMKYTIEQGFWLSNINTLFGTLYLVKGA